MRRVDVVLLTVSRNSSKCFLLLWIPWSYHQYSHQFFYQPVNPSELFYQHYLHPSVLWELLSWMHHSHTIKEHQFILSNALILHFLHIFFKQIRIIACTTKIWKAETGSYIISKMFIFYVTIYLWHVNRVRYFIEGNGMWSNGRMILLFLFWLISTEASMLVDEGLEVILLLLVSYPFSAGQQNSIGIKINNIKKLN